MSNADERSQGRRNQPGQEVDTDRLQVSTEWQAGPAGGETGQEGRGQGQVLPQNEDWGVRKQRLLPDQPPGPYFLLPPCRREAGAQVFKQLLPYLSGEKLLQQREGERI